MQWWSGLPAAGVRVMFKWSMLVPYWSWAAERRGYRTAQAGFVDVQLPAAWHVRPIHHAIVGSDTRSCHPVIYWLPLRVFRHDKTPRFVRRELLYMRWHWRHAVRDNKRRRIVGIASSILRLQQSRSRLLCSMLQQCNVVILRVLASCMELHRSKIHALWIRILFTLSIPPTQRHVSCGSRILRGSDFGNQTRTEGVWAYGRILCCVYGFKLPFIAYIIFTLCPYANHLFSMGLYRLQVRRYVGGDVVKYFVKVITETSYTHPVCNMVWSLYISLCLISQPSVVIGD